ncbi:hypothetical protein Acr_00g0071670 [Actinidia rufa]|uniref:Serine-rich protein-like protein n=1 Tax=Actinidia rufa TaxID=165716 RepID=A0A7J0DRU0_9ERIC|nr:hypothetical protein Acr_00g0071670 [Actinidia rufa]
MASNVSITVTVSTSPKSGNEELNSSKGQQCLCSPTTHQGSFRCRFHRPGSTAWFKRSKSMPNSKPQRHLSLSQFG